MNKNLIETVMGAVVLGVAIVFVWIFYTTTQIQTVNGYRITALFTKVGGLQSGSDVRVNGINVGKVTDRRLSEDFDAVVTMTIDDAVRLPADTSAVVTGDGLLGGTYIRLLPGRSAEKLAPGGRLAKTEDFKTIEDQVGEIIFLATGGSNGRN